jgi:hypothetical protein
MSKLVHESTGLALTADSRVDLEAGVIRGCKVLGSESRNRRTYPPALLRERHTIYEGAQVYANHDYAQLKHGRARPLQDWGGVLRAVSFRGDAVHGDVHCLKETPAGKIILEAAARCPDKFGLSAMHLIESKKNADGTETVTAILECWSVDAVTRPATTRTLFEEQQAMPDEPPVNGAAVAPVAAARSLEEAFAVLHTTLIASPDFSDEEKMSMWKDMNKLKSKWLDGGEEEEEETAAEAPAEEAHRRPVGRQARLIEDLAKSVRALTIRQMAGESLQLDAPTMATLLGLPDDNAVSAYLDNLRRQRRPKYSTGPARSSGRSVVSEAAGGTGLGRAPAAIPRLTAGADREAVKKFYRG